MYYEVIAVDFDGTLCQNKWPAIGEPRLDLIEWLKVKGKNGSRLILWTCREGELLEAAVDWCRDQGLIFDAVNDNLPAHIATFGGSNPRKVFADIYIDDKSLWPFTLDKKG